MLNLTKVKHLPIFPNPWKIESSKDIYSNPWISLTEFQVLNPAGNKGIYGKVHFKNLAIGVIPVDKEGYTWLVGQYRFPLEAYSWEIPEGGGQIDISPEESASRELLEETGLIAQKMVCIQKMYLSNSVSDELALIFLATELSAGKADPEDTEQLEVVRIPLEEAFARVHSGEITDSMSVAGLLKLELMMLKGFKC